MKTPETDQQTICPQSAIAAGCDEVVTAAFCRKIETQRNMALGRIRDLLMEEDGYAYKEARKFLESFEANMKLNHLIIIADALERVAEVQDTAMVEIIDALVGVCFDEEESGELKHYIADEEDV